MKLYFMTETPEILKTEIFDLISNGELDTWVIHTRDGIQYLRHTDQWGEKGVVKLVANRREQRLEARIIKFSNYDQPLETFQGYYLGRFCELMFNNFWSEFTFIAKED